jgi:hypothetical protein
MSLLDRAAKDNSINIRNVYYIEVLMKHLDEEHSSKFPYDDRPYGWVTSEMEFLISFVCKILTTLKKDI